MKSNFFNINRFALQLKRDLAQYRTMMLVLYAAISVPYLFKILISVFSWDVFEFHGGFQSLVYYGFLFITTIVLAATAFRDFRRDLTAQTYLLIPSSAFEKFLSMWLIVYVINFIGVTVSFFVINSVFVALSKVIGGQSEFFGLVHNFRYAGEHFGWKLLQPVFTTAVFFAGAASFKRDAWIKSLAVYLLVAFGFTILLIITILVFVKVFFADITTSGFGAFGSPNVMDPVSPLGKFTYLLGIFVMWAIAYFKITEKQV